jgi:hypothetical protein
MPASQICARCVACFSMERPFRHVLIGAISRASSRAEMVWREARRNSDLRFVTAPLDRSAPLRKVAHL